jgi:hypothetical protein
VALPALDARGTQRFFPFAKAFTYALDEKLIF